MKEEKEGSGKRTAIYKHPENDSFVLKGTGRKPKLLLELLKSGRSLDEFRVSQTSIKEATRPDSTKAKSSTAEVKKDVIDRLHKLLEKIERQATRLPFIKTLEWTGSCWAAIAYLADSKGEHTDSLCQLHGYIAHERQLAPWCTDWFVIDPFII